MVAFKTRLGVCLLLALAPARASSGPILTTPAQRPIVIDAGHGGQDLGAVVSGRREKDIVLSVARKLRDDLLAMGLGPVRLTRDSDDFVPLDSRVRETSGWEASLFISLHANKVLRRSLHGISVYAFGKGRGRSDRHHRRHRLVAPLPPPPAEEIRAGAGLAAILVRDLRQGGFRVETPQRADYYVLKNPQTPSVLVEMGYLSNPTEAALLADGAYQDRLAQALAQGVSDQLKFRALSGGVPLRTINKGTARTRFEKTRQLGRKA
jgi:N-acetylmuramoyl-L-alanine amidase